MLNEQNADTATDAESAIVLLNKEILLRGVLRNTGENTVQLNRANVSVNYPLVPEQSFQFSIGLAAGQSVTEERTKEMPAFMWTLLKGRTVELTVSLFAEGEHDAVLVKTFFVHVGEMSPPEEQESGGFFYRMTSPLRLLRHWIFGM